MSEGKFERTKPEGRVGTIAHIGINKGTTTLMAALAASMIAVGAPIPNIQIPKFKRTKAGYGFPPNLKMSFDLDLPKVAIEKVDIELILAELKPEHASVIEKIYTFFNDYDPKEEINEFIEWNNEFLAQLIFAGCKHCLTDLEEIIQTYKDNPRYKSIINDLDTLKGSFSYFSRSKILILLSAKESSNSYPISKDGCSFIKEFSSLEVRYSAALAKVKQFQKTQK